MVILDASLTTNSAGDPMTFAWFESGAANPFATNVVTKDLLGLGGHLIRLTVSSGDDVTSTNTTVQVITTGQAVAGLADRVGQSNLGRKVERLLTDALESAQRAFDRRQPRLGDVHLRVFQTNVRTHVVPSAPALAADFIQVAQEIIDAGQSSQPRPPRDLTLKSNGHGGKRLGFVGSPGQVHLVQVSTNLVDWATAGIATEVTPGSFVFDDPDTASWPTRFYRLNLP